MGTTISAFHDDKPILLDLEDFVRQVVKAAMPKPGKPAARDKELVPLGMGAAYHVEGDKLYIVVDVSPEAHKRAKLSNNKRNWLIASSKGNPILPESPIPGLRVALNLYTEENPPQD